MVTTEIPLLIKDFSVKPIALMTGWKDTFLYFSRNIKTKIDKEAWPKKWEDEMSNYKASKLKSLY